MVAIPSAAWSRIPQVVCTGRQVPTEHPAGCGTIFKITRGSSGSWTERPVYRFPGTPNAGTAYNGLISNGAGHFYGATVNGGTADDGAIYEFIP